MGAWGTGIFENDDAMDFVSELADGNADLDRALAIPGNDVEAPDASIALAAAEIVAALGGSPSPALPEEAQQWVAGRGPLTDPSLVGRALTALECATADDSELTELWEDAGEDEWRQPVEDLRTRLTSLRA